MEKLLARIKLYWALFKIKKNPKATNYIFDISDSLVVLGLFQETLKRLNSSLDCKTLIQERKILNPIQLNKLITYPPKSLGHEYASHMIRNQLDPNFYREPKLNSDVHYVLLRARQTHDLWHVVTGFDISELGEIGLQAFMMAQIQASLTPILVGGAIFRIGIENPASLMNLMNIIVTGWQMGKDAREFFPYDWESNWGKPLETVRSELGVNKVYLMPSENIA